MPAAERPVPPGAGRWLDDAPLVDFPLRGEWRALNTPAERVPSHGTDYFAQRYAIDLVQTDETGTLFHKGRVASVLGHLTVGIAAPRFHCWGQPVHSAFAGRVVAAADGWKDRHRVRLFWELVRSSVFPPSVGASGDLRPLAGNHVIVEGDPGFALYAHLRAGSVAVRLRERVASGAVLGAVGNSGNSTMPHLHFHLMDGRDPLHAKGLPFAFMNYQRWSGSEWVAVTRGMPGVLERIRA